MATNGVSLREYIERVVQEMDRRYGERWEAQQQAVQAALLAQEKAVQAAFTGANEAINKAEAAQRAYNERSNEFRAALDDAQKTLLSRAEAAAEFRRMEERIHTVANTLDAYKAALAEEIKGLRESRALAQGRGAGQGAVWAALGIIAGLLIGAIGIVLAVTKG